jgi:uncharacterized protein (TIGR02145 family)
MRHLSLSKIILVLLVMLFLNTCKKDSVNTPKIKKDLISGYVQKGPYVNGTSVQMYELTSSLNQTGKNFSTQIIDNKGSFEISNIALSSQYVEFLASGYYYNEQTGNISVAPLSLNALSDITDLISINVNLLTHLEKNRVEYLVNKGMTFGVAKDSAQSEILSIFGFKTTTMDQSEKLDISVNKEENAILLAISLILQGDRSVGRMTELLANISTDIKEDGVVNNNSILDSLRRTTLYLNLSAIRSNLIKRYQDLGVSVSIPDFEKYINIFLANTGLKPSVVTQSATKVTTNSTTLNGLVNANDLNTTVTFEYGTSDTYGSTLVALQSPVTGHTQVNVSVDLSGLTPGTQYHFRVKSVNSLGTVSGSDLIFTTLGKVPVVNTMAASDILASTATLKGSVNANFLSTSVSFEYGTTIDYGSINAIQSPVTGDTVISVSSHISGLNEGTLYHYRIVATNSLGKVNGSDMTFKTINYTSTQPASNVTTTSAVLNGTINASITFSNVTFEYGITTGYGNVIPAITNPVTGATCFKVNASVIGLSDGTIYHFRLVAVHSSGTIYGDDFTFETVPGTMSDIEGNAYKVVVIGTQIWMAENLKTTHFKDGSEIPLKTNNIDWGNLSSPGYCWYYNDASSYKSTYGALYNWYTVNTGNLCPSGWHVSSDAEWLSLTKYLGGASIAGGKLKEAGSAHWGLPNEGATNETGFTALPGGFRIFNGAMDQNGYAGYWWTSSESSSSLAWGSGYLDYTTASITRAFYDKRDGFSVRCIKD